MSLLTQSSSGATLLSIAMIAAFILAAGGLWLIAKRREFKKGLLMLAASAVLIMNVAIWVAPI